MTDADAFCAAVRGASKRMAAECKTDDIIQFIREHWYFWSSSRQVVTSTIEQLYRSNRGTTEDVADALGIPEGVYFKRVNREEVVKVFVDFPKSKLFDTFMECVQRQRSAEVCLFIVSGKSSIVITNMHVDTLPGQMQHYLKSRHNAKDVYIFPVSEVKDRMSKFNHEGENYE